MLMFLNSKAQKGFLSDVSNVSQHPWSRTDLKNLETLKKIVSAKGPNMSKKFTMDASFQPNLLSSTMNMPRNFVKQSSAASSVSQRSIYHGRDTSPTASICSDLQPRNFHQPFYQRGYSQRAVFNREGSPMSLRSMDSTASRADIVIDAIEKIQCSEDEWGKIWHVVNRKHEFRKKALKKRKMKMFLKNLQNKSEDEGEQGSCSSLSNDDCVSTRTGYSRRYDPYCKENVPRSLKSFDCQSEDMYRNRHAYREYAKSASQNPYQTGTYPYLPANSLPYQKQPQFGPTYFSQKNVYSQNDSSIYSQSNTGLKNSLFSQRCIGGQANMSSIQRNNLNGSFCSTKSMQNMTMMSQRERFRGGFQFPSQKINRIQDQLRNTQFSDKHCTTKANNIQRDNIAELSDENDDIFLDTTSKPKAVAEKTQKRKVESLGDIPNPTKKKLKVTSSNDKTKRQTQKNDANEKNEFEFVKPQFPVRKSAPAKPLEKLISKSSNAPVLIEEIEQAHPQPTALSPEPDVEPEQSENTQLTTSDMSMRPSFMKRKLFTQTLDVTEKKNNSFESGTDSPQSNIYSSLTREKHKTRKLTTSQSLLSRDVNQDDDNLLDLIHKIVPPNQVNSTITANTSKPHTSRMSGTKQGDDKWDITSIISTCNNDSVSETYTDDEIFKVSNDKKSKAQEKPIPKKGKMDDKSNKPVKTNDKPKPEIKKPDNVINPTNNKNVKEIAKKMPAVPKVATPAKVCPAKRVVLSRSRIDAFWDTDESDHECAGALQPFNLPTLGVPDQIEHHIGSPKKTSTEGQSSTLLTKAKTIQTKTISPLVVLQELKKQPSKKVVNKTNKPKTPKKPNGISKANNLDKNKNGTPTITPRTRRQLNLSTRSETVIDSRIREKVTSVNETAPNKTKNQKKQNNGNKANKVKNVKTPPSPELKENRNKKQIVSQQQINISKRQGDTPKNQKTAKKNVKTTKLPEPPTEHLKIDMCKLLRSRKIDLSSSFNSDKFELTMSRTRKSRTPSKRISFNKSKNVLVNNNKIRSRATKS